MQAQEGAAGTSGSSLSSCSLLQAAAIGARVCPDIFLLKQLTSVRNAESCGKIKESQAEAGRRLRN